MYIAYMDEAGDDGYPKYSSELFVLVSVYMHYQSWKDNYQKMVNFRRSLRNDFGFPVKLELHLRPLLTDKHPYKQFGWGISQKQNILFAYFQHIAALDLRIINVVINKKRIVNPHYEVLHHALNYNIQRIENDLSSIGPEHRFMVVVDEGRIGKTRKVARKIQRINYIPSRVIPGTSYRREIEKLIEDPLTKESRESYFIQIADAVSYVTYLYALRQFNDSDWAKRVQAVIDFSDVVYLLESVKGVLNLEATRDNEYGIVNSPR